MKILVYTLIILIFPLYGYSEQCPVSTAPLQNSTDPLPGLDDFLNNYTDGFHQFQGNANISSGLYLSYWDAEKITFPDLPSYSSPSNGSTVGYSLNGCRALDSDGRGVHCQYLSYKTKQCPVGYQLSYSSGQCQLNDLQACLDSQPVTCSDGLPPDLGGFPACDRPLLKKCSNGAYVRKDTGICPTVCSDYLSCYKHVLKNSSCASATYFEFNYTNPENFDFTCTQIASDSPDNSNNGGNADGNPYNDPNTPSTGQGSTPDTSSIDPYSLAGLIGDELVDDFSNVERSIREGSDKSTANTETLNASINGVEAAVRDGTQSGLNNSNSIKNSVDALGSKLDAINNSLNSGSCNPKSPDYYQCINAPLSNLPAHSSTGTATTIAEANANFKARIDGSQLIQAFSGMANLINLSNAQCPVFSIDLRGTVVNELVSTTVHCDLMETIKPLIGSMMIIIYIWISFRIFASA